VLRVHEVYKRVAFLLIHDHSVPRRSYFTIRDRANEVAKVANERVLVFLVMIINVVSAIEHLKAYFVSPD
jgi:hypothetical protein